MCAPKPADLKKVREKSSTLLIECVTHNMLINFKTWFTFMKNKLREIKEPITCAEFVHTKVAYKVKKKPQTFNRLEFFEITRKVVFSLYVCLGSVFDCVVKKNCKEITTILG